MCFLMLLRRVMRMGRLWRGRFGVGWWLLNGMDPHVGMHYLLLGSVAVFFGGVDRYWAWGAGAMLLAALQSLAVWKFSAQWTDLVTFGVLIFVLLFRPQGLFGLRKRLEET